MKKYRQFNEEFKKTLVAQIDSGVISKAAATRENDISPSLITRWQNQIHESSMQSWPTVCEHQLEKELDRYKKKVGELTIQNELLKKLNQTYPSTRKSCGCIVREYRSVREACKMISLSEFTYSYNPKASRKDRERTDDDLRDKIETLQAQYSCWGHRTLRVQLWLRYSLQVNGKRILRVMLKYDLF